MPHEPNEEPLSVDKRAIGSSFIRLSARNPLDQLRLLWWTLVIPQQFKRYQEQFGEAAVKQTGKWLVSTLIWLPILYPILALGLETLPRFAEAFPPTTYLWISGFLFIAWLLTGIFGDGENCGMVVLGLMLWIVLWIALVMVLKVVPFVVLGIGPAGILAGALALVLTGVVAGDIATVLAVLLVVTNLQIFATTLKVVVGGGQMGGPLIGSLGGFFVYLVSMPLLVFAGVLGRRLLDVVKESVKTGNPSRVGRRAFGLLVAAHVFLVWFSFLGGWRVFGGLF